MFKPVTDFSEYDPETVELYKRRANDHRLEAIMINLARRARNHLPVYVSKDNETVQKLEKEHSSFLWKLGFSSLAFCKFIANP
jgi:hypothetical protein